MDESKYPKVEGIEGFLNRAASAGFRELWASIGEDEQAGIKVLHLSPRCDTPEAAEKAKADGICTRSFFVEGDNLYPQGQQMTFSEAIMRSGMPDADKIRWLYDSLREWEEKAITGQSEEASH